LKYKNPEVQMVTLKMMTPTPWIKVYFGSTCVLCFISELWHFIFHAFLPLFLFQMYIISWCISLVFLCTKVIICDFRGWYKDINWLWQPDTWRNSWSH